MGETVLAEKLQNRLLRAVSSTLRNVDSDELDQKHLLFKTTVEYILDKFKYVIG